MPSSCLATSTCLLGYRWLYVSIVVCTFSCPSRSAISSGEKPISTSRLAWLCRYGIINLFNIWAFLRLRCALVSLDISGYSIFSTPTTPENSGDVCNTFATLNSP